MKNNQSGMLMVEALVFLLVVSIFAAIAIPKVTEHSKVAATKAEMSNVIAAIQLYEVDKDHLPSSLGSLKPSYFADDKFKKDAWSTLYTYDKVLRKLCSTNTLVGCKTF